eukprot:15156646-Alexandrium_andersonii.AAC.1
MAVCFFNIRSAPTQDMTLIPQLPRKTCVYLQLGRSFNDWRSCLREAHIPDNNKRVKAPPGNRHGQFALLLVRRL